LVKYKLKVLLNFSYRCFLLIFGMQGILTLILGDTQGLDEMNMMPGTFIFNVY
jgi:hypothetical protein